MKFTVKSCKWHVEMFILGSILSTVLRNKRKRISYNKNAAYEEAIRKEEERRLKQLQVSFLDTN